MKIVQLKTETFIPEGDNHHWNWNAIKFPGLLIETLKKKGNIHLKED